MPDDGVGWAMIDDFFVWLGSLPQGGPQFVGAVFGSALGLLSLLLGALFNAHLNRARDRRLRDDEAKGMAGALRGELGTISASLKRNADNLCKSGADNGKYLIPDPSLMARIMPKMADKLTLLDAAKTQAVISAYCLLDQFCEYLILRGGRFHENLPDNRRVIVMPGTEANYTAALCQSTARYLDIAIEHLNKAPVVRPWGKDFSFMDIERLHNSSGPK